MLFPSPLFCVGWDEGVRTSSLAILDQILSLWGDGQVGKDLKQVTAAFPGLVASSHVHPKVVKGASDVSACQ